MNARLESPDGTPWQPVLRLRSQLAVEPLQTALFVPEARPCPHVAVEWQRTFSGRTEPVCVACGVVAECEHVVANLREVSSGPCADVICACGATVDHLEPCKVCGAHVSALHGVGPVCDGCFDFVVSEVNGAAS